MSDALQSGYAAIHSKGPRALAMQIVIVNPLVLDPSGQGLN